MPRLFITKQTPPKVPEINVGLKRVNENPTEKLWRSNTNIALEQEKRVREIFESAADRLRDDINLRELERNFRNNQTGMIEAQINIPRYQNDLEEITEPMTDALNNAAQNYRLHLPPRNRGFTFNILNSPAIAWIEQQAGVLIKQISDETLIAIREIIRQSYLEGVNPRVAAKNIKGVVGLTSRQAMAVNNLRKAQLEAGVPLRTTLRNAEIYRNRLIKFRAETIARTEMLRAANAGNFYTIDAAIDQGALSRETIKVWYTAADERTCFICRPLDLQERNFYEPFTTSLGNIMFGPVHPKCRCTFVTKEPENVKEIKPRFPVEELGE